MTDLDMLYGKCRLNDQGKPCLCLNDMDGMGARYLCPHWITVSVLVGRPISSYADLVAAMQEIKNANDSKDT